MKSKTFLTCCILTAAYCLWLAGCEYDVPITSSPTHKVDERLLGNWVSQDQKDGMQIGKYDDANYVVSLARQTVESKAGPPVPHADPKMPPPPP